MRQVQPGFVRPAEVQTFDLALPAALIRDPQQVARTLRTDRRAPEAGTGRRGCRPWHVDRDGRRRRQGSDLCRGPACSRNASYSCGQADWARVFRDDGQPGLAGRAITWTDIFQLKPVVVISENLAREYWEEPAKAFGKRIGGFPEGPGHEIVGVVGNERADGLNHPAPALVYWPMADAGQSAAIWRMSCDRTAWAHPGSCASCSKPSGRSIRICRLPTCGRWTRFRPIRWPRRRSPW